MGFHVLTVSMSAALAHLSGQTYNEQLHQLVNDVISVPLTISTKYYNAPIQMILLSPLSLSQLLDSSSGRVLNGLITEAEAIVAVVEHGREDSQLSEIDKLIQRWGSPEFGGFDPEICLVIDYNTPSAEACTVSVQDWALDHQFEAISLVLGDGGTLLTATSADTSQRSGNLLSTNDDELQGLPRIMQALQCHHWRSAVLQSVPLSHMSASFTDSQSLSPLAIVPNNNDSVADAVSTESTRRHLVDTTTTNTTTTTGGVQLDALAMLAEDGFREGLTADDPAIQAFENEMEQFERLMGQINLVRDNASSMSDQQRRQMAAEVALALYEQWGGGDEDMR